MGRTSARPQPGRERVLVPARRLCPACGGVMRLRYENRRTLVMLSGPVRLRLKVRRCEREGCARRRMPYRPEAEGAMALAQHEFGLDVVALVGTLRHHGHRSVPEIHAALRGRGVEIAERSVTNLLDRYDELLATSLTDGRRLRTVLAQQGRAILALDGMQPDMGHEVFVGGARVPVGRGAAGAQPAVGHCGRPRAPAARGGGRDRRAGRGRDQRWPDLDPAPGGGRAARGGAPAVPVPLPARGGEPGPRGGPPRQEGAEEAGARGAPDRAGGRGPQ